MGFAAGMSAGSAAARSAVDAFTNSRDHMKQAEQEAAIQAELAKLEGTKAPMNAPRAEFGAQGGAGLQGFGFGAPQGGEITSAPTGRTQGLALPQGAPLSAGSDAGDGAGFQAGNVAPAPRALSGSEREAIYGNVARIKGDINGMRLSDQNRAAFSFKEGYTRYMKEYDPENADHVKESARWLNVNDGSITVGVPDKKGYSTLMYVDPKGDGQEIRVSPMERAQLFAAGRMMEEDADAALGKIAGVNKGLAETLRNRNAALTSVTGANNTVNNLRNDDTHNDLMRAENVRNNKVREGLSRQQLASQERDRKDNANYRAQQTQLARLGATRYERGQDGNTYALTPTMTPQGLKFERQMVNPDGIQFQKPFDPKEYASTVASFAEANGGNIKQARIEADQLYGRGPGTQLENPALRARDAQVAEDTKNPSQARGRQVSPALAPRPVNLAPVGRSEVTPSAPQAAPGGAQILSRVNDGRYNVRMPDGTTALVTEDVALQMGLVEPPQPRRGFQLPSNVQNNFLTYGGMPGYDY